jgi:hypothetical protein
VSFRRTAIPAALAVLVLESGCVMVEGKLYWSWVGAAVPPVGPGPRCEPLQAGSGSLLRVRLVDGQDQPLPGFSVRFTPSVGGGTRIYPSTPEGIADAWLPSGTWKVETEMINSRRGTAVVELAGDTFCEMTFRMVLPDSIED